MLRIIFVVFLALGLSGCKGQSEAERSQAIDPMKWSWDVKDFDRCFKILETSYDPKEYRITWLLEYKGQANYPYRGFHSFDWKLQLYNAKDVRIKDESLDFTPSDPKVGEKIQVIASLLGVPREQIIKAIIRCDSCSRDEKISTNSSPSNKPSASPELALSSTSGGDQASSGQKTSQQQPAKIQTSSDLGRVRSRYTSTQSLREPRFTLLPGADAPRIN